jgi:hypothetical protein
MHKNDCLQEIINYQKNPIKNYDDPNISINSF